jgi:hypothetical protein
MPWLSSQLTVLGTKAGADASAATSAPAKPEPGVRLAYQRDRTHVYRHGERIGRQPDPVLRRAQHHLQRPNDHTNNHWTITAV